MTGPTTAYRKEPVDMQDLFDKQKAFQTRLKNDIYAQSFITHQTLAAVVELAEAVQETPWKPWKKSATYNVEKFQEELIDVLHFLINLFLASGMDAQDVYYKFMEKNKENFDRQDRGY